MAVVSSCRRMSGFFPVTSVTLYYNCAMRNSFFYNNWHRCNVCAVSFRMTSSLYGLYGLGYTCATMVTTKRCNCVSMSKSVTVIFSSDCFLKLENMK
jgi:hypothetical protein